MNKYACDFANLYLNELGARVVAASGVPTDLYHLGKLIHLSLKDEPHFISQIDGATGASEICQSVLERSIKCAIHFRNLEIKRGDNMVIIASNYLETPIPFYAALFEGIGIAPMDKNLSKRDLQLSLGLILPKIIFCENKRMEDIVSVLNSLNHKADVVPVDNKEFNSFIEGHATEKMIATYKPANFNCDDTIAFLIPTSGTTGAPKTTIITHKNYAITTPYLWRLFTNFPKPTRMHLVLSPLQWLTALMGYVYTPIFRITRLQTSQELMDKDNIYHLINSYKPTFTITSPTLMTSLLNPADREKCDFSCFEVIFIGGSNGSKKLFDEIRNLIPRTIIYNTYGMSEMSGIGLEVGPHSTHNLGSPIGLMEYRVVDPSTGKDISDPKQPGELWVRGPNVCKGYYKNREATEEAFALGGWFKTGDILTMDEKMNFCFIDRIKLMLKYKNNQISPMEIENVICTHPAVLDAAVTAIQDDECGDLPVACVVRRNGSHVTAQEIKELVKNHLTDFKQLRGGVVFLSKLPMTATTKVDRVNLKKMVLSMDRE